MASSNLLERCRRLRGLLQRHGASRDSGAQEEQWSSGRGRASRSPPYQACMAQAFAAQNAFGRACRGSHALGDSDDRSGPKTPARARAGGWGGELGRRWDGGATRLLLAELRRTPLVIDLSQIGLNSITS